jgi:bacterioferritin (cytochrome b1)
MGLISWVAASLRPKARRLTRLAQIGGESARLAASLRRHAVRCAAPRIKESLETLAAAEAADADIMRQLIVARGEWPTRPLPPLGEGSNNWARLGADLAAEVKLVRALNAAIAECEGADRELAERLRSLVTAKEDRLSMLRDLTLKCDPQALD